MDIYIFLQESGSHFFSWCIRTIHLITTHPFAQTGKKKTSTGFWKHIYKDRGSERICKYWILLWREQMGQGNIRHRKQWQGETNTKHNLINKKTNKLDIKSMDEESISMNKHTKHWLQETEKKRTGKYKQRIRHVILFYYNISRNVFMNNDCHLILNILY